MFDNVRIRDTQITREMGLAAMHGQVYGETKPSIIGIEVIGESKSDHALNVKLDDREETLWFAPELIEYVDHSPGTIIEIGNKKLERQEDGSWKDLS